MIHFFLFLQNAVYSGNYLALKKYEIEMVTIVSGGKDISKK